MIQSYFKPVKTFFDAEGLPIRKANCDVDMAFYLMRDRNTFERALVLSGDGDFLPVLKFLKENKKEVLEMTYNRERHPFRMPFKSDIISITGLSF